jgi:hypothetical protein
MLDGEDRIAVPAEEGVAALSVVGERPRSRLEEIGVGLASFLQTSDARAWLLGNIARSPFVEKRVPFKRLILADTSTRVREILQRSGRAVNLVELGGLPDLELYIPVKSHLLRASSSSDFQVAVRTTADSFYIIRSDGSAFRVNEWYDPGSRITVVLGRSEIDYDDAATALRAARSREVRF